MNAALAKQTIDQLAATIDTLFAPSGQDLLAICQEARQEITAIATRRDLQTLSIAVIGGKNAGKSWLCRRLIKDPANRARIPCGEEDAQSTRKATWIGPSAPPELDAASEEHLPLAESAMVDLGRSYVLLDLPGYNAATGAERTAALRAIHGAGVRVLVVSSQTLDDEFQWAYLQESDGTCVLPVVVDNAYPGLQQDGIPDVGDLQRRLKRFCPKAEITPTIVIPHVQRSPGSEQENERLADEILTTALRDLLARPEPDPSLAVTLRFERFRTRLVDALRPWMEGIEPAYESLVAEEIDLAARLLGQVLGSESALESGTRMKMRMLTVARTPAGYFPYRTILGLFGLTAGAWDRLAFALAGSLPSLALLAFQTSRNLKTLGQSLRETKDALKARVEAMASEQLLNRNEVFVRALRQRLPDLRICQNAGLTPSVSGLDEVTAESGAIFERVLEKYSPGRWLTGFWGAWATLAFFGLAAGPAVAVYREFVEVWLGVFQRGEPIRWEAFPTPSAAMIFSTLLLMLLPVVVCALITMARSAPKVRVLAAVAEIRDAHRQLQDQLAANKVVRLTSNDPTREAVRVLLDFARND